MVQTKKKASDTMLFDLGEDELQTLLEMFKYLLLGTNVLLFLTAALVFFTSSASENSASSSSPAQFKRALIVTAHPDDESMFFLPLVHSLQPQEEGSSDVWQTHLLCLSRGNFDGLGGIREKELKACATYIGLSTDHVQVLEDPKLQDGMKTQWGVAHIAAVVASYVEKHKIDAVSGVLAAGYLRERERADHFVSVFDCRSSLSMTTECQVMRTTLLRTLV